MSDPLACCNTSADGAQFDKSADRVRGMFGEIAHRYDLANTVLSGGVHHLWRRTLLARLAARGPKRILDVCTGTGDLLRGLGSIAGPDGTVIGADFCMPMLEVAATKVVDAGGRIPLCQGDALALPFPAAAFDAVTVAFGVRNFESLPRGLSELWRVLAPGGTLSVLEFGQPRQPIFRALYNWYSRVLMPRIGGLVTGRRAAYRYLPETAKEFPCGDQFLEAAAPLGPLNATAHSLTFGIAYLYEITKVK